MKKHKIMNYLILLIGLIFTQSSFAETYILENGHSFATFKIMHQNKGMLPGVFKNISGSFEIDKKNQIKSISVAIDVNSIDTYHPARNAHLKSSDFFNSKRYPQMTFKSTKILFKKKGLYEVEGDLTIHGKTKKVNAKVTRGFTGKDPFGGHGTGGNVYLTINRRDFGMSQMPATLVGDKVEIDLFWEALEKSTVKTYEEGLKKALSGEK